MRETVGQKNSASIGQWPWLRFVVGKNPKHTLIRAGIVVVAAFIIFKFCIRLVRIEGISMDPNFRDQQILVVNKLAYWRGDPQRGDVVAVRTAGEHVLFLKRIIALPGEKIAIRQGQVWIDGQPLDEPYLKMKSAPWNYPEKQLGADEYFLIGDNRTMEDDAHTFGRQKRERIIGKVLF